jgi:uncharacterized SAM-binding protein YcdF (DUF218 family)
MIERAWVRPGSRRRTIRVMITAFVSVALAWGIGFAWFLHLVAKPAGPPTHADGIVAFTGGPDRVETALRLLTEGRADRLLLSGIGGGAELSELAKLAGIPALPIAARVTMGRHAMTTRGNAIETAAWARANSVHSLLVVTAAYHLPRAIAELARVMPDAEIHPVPVISLQPVPLRLLTEEYVKYLAAISGLTTILPEKDKILPRQGNIG